MIKFLADENFNNTIVRGVLRKRSDIDIVRVQDVGLAAASDPTVLEWAAAHKRLVLTHDVQTFIDYAYQRAIENLPMPGVVIVDRSQSLARVIDDLIILADCSTSEEWEGQVIYIPLR